MFTVSQIDHVEFFVPDQYEAARWYERVLGLKILPECEGWAAGGGPLMISSDGGSTKLALFAGRPTPAPQTAAFRRVAFRVTARGFADFLEHARTVGLTDGGGQPLTRESVVDHDQAFSIYFQDPYGHLLEITTYEYAELTTMMRGA